jgi:hypothetical protein
MTPLELDLILKNHEDQYKNKINELLFVAWHVEAFARQKKLPKLSKIITDKKKKPVKKDNRDMLNMIRNINAALGGKEVSK